MKTKFFVVVLVSLLVLSIASASIVIQTNDRVRERAKAPEKSPVIGGDWILTPLPVKNVNLVKKIRIHGSLKEIEGRNSNGEVKKPLGKGKQEAATGILGASSTGNTYAIIIGISDYPGTVNDLEYPDDDALDMFQALTILYGYNPGNIHLILDSDAYYSNIYNAVMDVKSKALAGDEIVFFFSGHGAEGEANDGDTETIDEAIYVYGDYIWDGELRDWFSDFDTTRIVFIFDSCLAGGMTDLEAEGRVINMATTETGTAYEWDKWGNGQFTYYFVDEGMIQGKADKYDHDIDGVLDEGDDVVIEEAFDYSKHHCKLGQKPTISDLFTNDLLLDYGKICILDVDCNDNNGCTTEVCETITGKCVFTPVQDGTPCVLGICCSGNCAAITCSLDTECDDGYVCTTDTCINPGICGASCSNVQIIECIDGDGCCPLDICDFTTDSDCGPVLIFCGDRYCAGSDLGEDCFSCPEDCRCSGKNCAQSCCGDGICNNNENINNCLVDCR